MSKVIWAPWRMEFIEGKSPGFEGCVFCHHRDLSKDEYSRFHVFDSNNGVLVILNKYPYTNAHLLVIPHSHVSNLEDLDRDEYTNLALILRKTVVRVKKAINPQGLNVGMNLGASAGAGIADHLHYHIVPRWQGDNNFMPVIGSTRVMPQYLDETYEKLLPFLGDSCSLG
ncbi:MAG: HIT family protein [Myxococcota bacterium]